MVSSNTCYIQWLSVAKPTLKVAPAGRNHSSVALTNKCRQAIRFKIIPHKSNPRMSFSFFFLMGCDE